MGFYLQNRGGMITKGRYQVEHRFGTGNSTDSTTQSPQSQLFTLCITNKHALGSVLLPAGGARIPYKPSRPCARCGSVKPVVGATGSRLFAP
jgi:hypothetical protein